MLINFIILQIIKINLKSPGHEQEIIPLHITIYVLQNTNCKRILLSICYYLMRAIRKELSVPSKNCCFLLLLTSRSYVLKITYFYCCKNFVLCTQDQFVFHCKIKIAIFLCKRTNASNIE